MRPPRSRSVSEIADPPREDSRAAAVKKSATAQSRVTGSTRPASTISLAQSTGSRDGTTASVARIIPVPYSPLNASTPSTPITSCANNRPSRLADTPAAAELPAEIVYGAPDPAIAAPRPTISTTALSAHHQVERSARSWSTPNGPRAPGSLARLPSPGPGLLRAGAP